MKKAAHPMDKTANWWAGTLWPAVRTHSRFKVSRLVPLRRALPSPVCLSGLVALTRPGSVRKPGTGLHWLSRRWRRRRETETERADHLWQAWCWNSDSRQILNKLAVSPGSGESWERERERAESWVSRVESWRALSWRETSSCGSSASLLWLHSLGF
jgi:hypothetical protein